MKNPILAIVAFCAIALLPACWTSAAKRAALFPPAALAWPAVEEDFDRGVADGVEDGDLTDAAAVVLTEQSDSLGSAISAKDIDAVRAVPWSTLEPWAERGIADKLEDGEIGPGVAASLTEQLSNFTATIDRLRGAY